MFKKPLAGFCFALSYLEFKLTLLSHFETGDFMKAFIIATTLLVSMGAQAIDVCVIGRYEKRELAYLQAICTNQNDSVVLEGNSFELETNFRHYKYKISGLNDQDSAGRAELIKNFLEKGYSLQSENVFVKK